MITRRIRASPVKVTGVAPGDQRFESFLEEEFLVLMRYRHDVTSFERPETSIPWKDKDGKIRQYTPDLIVRYKPDEDHPKGRTIVCEVKPNFGEDEGTPASLLPRDEDDEENKLKWAAAALWAEARGWSFKVFQSTDIRSAFLQNAKFLVKYVERTHSEVGREELLSILRESGPMRLMDLMERARPVKEERALLFPTLYTQIVRGVIDVDLSVRLTNHSTLSIGDET